MKAFNWSITVSALAVLGSSFLIGCYTQLARTEDEPAASVEPQTTESIQPPPTVIIVEPVIIVPVSPPIWPSPVVSTPSPGTGTNSQSENQRRDFGIHRTDPPNSGNSSTGAGNRSGGSTRGKR